MRDPGHRPRTVVGQRRGSSRRWPRCRCRSADSSASSRSSAIVCRKSDIDAMVDGQFASSSRCRPRSSSAARRPIRRSIAATQRGAPRRCRTASVATLRPICSRRSTSARTRSTTRDPFYAAQRRGAFAPNIWPAVAGRASTRARRVLPVGASVGPDPDRGLRDRARTSRSLVLAVRRSLDDDDASHPLRAPRRRG